MNDPKIALKKIDLLLSRWVQNREMESVYYSSVKILLSEISSFCESNEVSDYTLENITKANWHVNAMFEADIDNGHDFYAHCSWALGSIEILGGDLCLGTFNY